MGRPSAKIRPAIEDRAKKLLVDLATNWVDPESFVSHREAADPNSKPDETYLLICRVGQAVQFAFEAKTAYDRDWFLTWARVENASALSGAMLGQPYVGTTQHWIPSAEGSQIDQCVLYVQRKLQKKMRACKWKGCKAYFFREPGHNMYCSEACEKAKVKDSNRRSYHKTGKARRKARGLVPLSCPLPLPPA